MAALRTTGYKSKVLLEKSAFKINTTIYVNHSIGIYCMQLKSTPALRKRETRRKKVKHDCLAHACLKDDSGLLQLGSFQLDMIVLNMLTGNNMELNEAREMSGWTIDSMMHIPDKLVDSSVQFLTFSSIVELFFF